MRRHTLVQKIRKIDYDIDGGLFGTCMILYLGSARHHKPIRLNERLTNKYIKKLKVGDLIRISSVYNIDFNTGDYVIFDICHDKEEPDETAQAEAEKPEKMAKRRPLLRHVNAKRILLSKRKGSNG